MPRSALSKVPGTAAPPKARKGGAARGDGGGRGPRAGGEGREGLAGREGDSAIARALRMLDALAGEGRPIALTDLAQRLDLPKATAHRVAEHLIASGHAMRDVDERRIAVGPALRRLALDALKGDALRAQRHAVLAELVAEVNETCNFTTPDGASVLYLDRVEAHWPLRLTLDVGSHVPMHCTASGKLFLASMPREERAALIERLPLTRMTPATLTTARALAAECDAIAAQGYSTDREEFIAGLIAVAVPVATGGVVRAAVAMHAPVARVTLAAAMKRVGAIRKAAGAMEALL